MKLKFFIPGILLSAGVIIFFAGCKPETKNLDDDAAALLDLEKEAIKREFQNDTSFLSLVMDSTFIELSADTIKNKHQVLKTIFRDNLDKLENKVSLDSFRLEQPIVHLYGDASVVTFILHTFRKKEDSAFERRTRFYDVWVKRDGHWKAVTWQASPL